MAETDNKKSTRDALELMDRRFGIGSDSAALHEQFAEQAEVAEMLYAARKKAGLTQTQLAELAGTTQQVISCSPPRRGAGPSPEPVAMAFTQMRWPEVVVAPD